MFDEQAFLTWPLILVGAALFAGMFMLLALMAELLLDGAFRMTPGVVGFGVAAFIGYVGTAVILRQDRSSPGN